MTLKQITEDNFPNLLRSVDPSVDLLGRLRSIPFVKDRISSIREQFTFDSKNDSLLNALLEVPGDIQDSVMNGFISALRSSGQDHVANIFRRESDKVLMSDEHYKLLSRKQFDLCKFMNPRDGLIHCLISFEVFTEMDKEKIFSKAGLDDMTKETVNVLLRKSDCAFGKFVSALNETNQSHVGYLLTGVGKQPMSDEHRRILNTKMQDLENFTDTENGLLDRLLSHEVVTMYDAEQIRSVTDLNVMARKLVKILMRKSDDAFEQFIALLRETGQTHVAYILTGESSSRPLKEEYRRRLLSSPRDILVNTIDSKNSGLITSLMDKGVFSTYDEQRVTSVRPDTHEDRNEMILNLIARKSQSDFFKFISALNVSDQTHVVVTLIGANIVAKIKTVYESRTDSGHMPDVDTELLEYMQEAFQLNGKLVTRLNEILSKNGVTVSDVRKGCIEITLTCLNVESLHSLHGLNNSGELENMLNEAFCSPFSEKGLKSLKVVICNEQFEQCAQTFAHCIPMTSGHHETLLTSAEWLLNEIIVNSDLLDVLPLCRRRRQAIESAATPEQQVKTLIDIVLRQPDSAFTQLLDTLNHTQQTKAVDIISSVSRSLKMKIKANTHELQTRAPDICEKVDQTFAQLRHSITRYNLDECLQVSPVFCHIWCDLYEVVTSVRNLREQYSAPTARPSVYEELKQLLSKLVSSTQSQVQSGGSMTLSHDPELNEDLKLKFGQLQPTIINSVNPAGIVNFLFQEAVISHDDFRTLDSLRDDPQQQCYKLLTLLHTSENPLAFVQLYAAIKEELDLEWLIDRVDPSIDLQHQLYISESTVGQVVHTLPEGEQVCGVTSLAGEVYVLRGKECDQVEVFDVINYRLQRLLTVPNSRGFTDMTSCEHYRCVYIADHGVECIHRLHVQGAVTRWAVHDKPRGLSVNAAHNVLVTYPDVRTIREFSSHGDLLRELTLAEDIINPWHAIQTRNGEFIVCHGYFGDAVRRVCKISADGRHIVQSHGGQRGSDIGQYDVPCHLAVDNNEFVFLTDLVNRRVSLLSPTIDFVREVVSHDELKRYPWRLHLDFQRRRLYVAYLTGSAVVFSV